MASTTDTMTDFVALLASIARGEAADFIHLLTEYHDPIEVAGTRTTLRTHFITSDANGTPATELLSGAMASAMVDFCIPRSRIQRAHQSLVKTGSSAEMTRLALQARDLFVDLDGTGEGGELLLFLLMERLLKLPQLIAKMTLKTSSNMHVHGSDGVHGRFGADGVLDLYWGESKLHKSASSAFSECFKSIGPFLGADGDARKRDLLLLRDQMNVVEEDLAVHLLEYFDPSNPKALEVRWNGVCLVGFDYSAYPDIKKASEEQGALIDKGLHSWMSMVTNGLTKHILSGVNIDVFCIPFPDVDEFRKKLRHTLGLK